MNNPLSLQISEKKPLLSSKLFFFSLSLSLSQNYPPLKAWETKNRNSIMTMRRIDRLEPSSIPASDYDPSMSAARETTRRDRRNVA